MCASGHGHLRSACQAMIEHKPAPTEARLIMRSLDQLCAAALFLAAMADSLLVPRNYIGRIWIFGTCLALLFAAMLNWLRIRHGQSVRQLRMFCIVANISLLAFAISLILSIGRARTLANRQIPFITVLLLAETIFSLGGKG